MFCALNGRMIAYYGKQPISWETENNLLATKHFEEIYEGILWTKSLLAKL